MRLILLTLPCAVEPVPLDTCFEAGLQTLHVRKPDWTRPQLRAYLQTVAPQYRRRLVLHSCHELSAEFDVGVSSAALAKPDCMAMCLHGILAMVPSCNTHQRAPQASRDRAA